jgi:hypothetical protein
MRIISGCARRPLGFSGQAGNDAVASVSRRPSADINVFDVAAKLVGLGQEGETARFVAAVSGRTHKKDSFAAPKTLPFNDFSHFAQCA